MRQTYLLHPPPIPMPRLLREIAGRWCHKFVCLVLTLDIYDLGMLVQKKSTYYDQTLALHIRQYELFIFI